jgi:hypothetical protein
MVFQNRPRLLCSVLSSVLLASMLSCGGGANGRSFTRFGEDALVAGGSPTVTDSVIGDVIVAGGEVEFRGSAGGDYVGVGGSQVVGGRIHGSVRAAGGNVEVTGVVDRNATVAGGNVALDSVGVITRNAYFTGGSVHVNGTVNGGLLASGGTVTLNGVVGRDVEIAGGELYVGARTRIAGNLRYRVPAKKVHIDPAARITGTVTALPVSGRGMWRWLWPIGMLLAGAVAVALWPRLAAETAAIFGQAPVRSALVGVGSFILFPLAIILVAVTRIGIPLALLTTAVFVVLVCLASIPFAVWLGQRLLGARARAGRQGVLVNFLVGGVILLVVGLIPFIGDPVMLLAAILGLGAIMLRAWASRRESASVAAG